jgi:tRNA(Glu) U13 pseudouridine synthase TruD
MSKQHLGLGDYQLLRYTAVERYPHLVMISHQFLTHLARDRSGVKEQRKGRDVLRLVSVEKMQTILWNTLCEDRIKSLADGSKYRAVAKKLKDALVAL